MAKQQFHIRAATRTKQQIRELAEMGGTTMTEVIAVAVDRLHRETEWKQQHLTQSGDVGPHKGDIYRDGRSQRQMLVTHIYEPSYEAAEGAMTVIEMLQIDPLGQFIQVDAVEFSETFERLY